MVDFLSFPIGVSMKENAQRWAKVPRGAIKKSRADTAKPRIVAAAVSGPGFV